MPVSEFFLNSLNWPLPRWRVKLTLQKWGKSPLLKCRLITQSTHTHTHTHWTRLDWTGQRCGLTHTDTHTMRWTERKTTRVILRDGTCCVRCGANTLPSRGALNRLNGRPWEKRRGRERGGHTLSGGTAHKLTAQVSYSTHSRTYAVKRGGLLSYSRKGRSFFYEHQLALYSSTDDYTTM